MVINRRSLIALVSSSTLLALSSSPVLAGYSPSEPDPLRREQLVRLQAMATTQNLNEQPAVAVGWREGRKPGRMYLSFSLDGGQSFLRDNGKTRRFSVAGNGNRGMSLAVCADSVWAGTSAHYPGDKAGDSDVLITRRVIGTGGNQVFVTPPATDRKVRDVSVACVGTNLLAIAWLEKSGGRSKARLMLRDLESLAPAATKQTFGLGGARFAGGIAVAATGRSVHVAWTKGNRKKLRYRRFLIGTEADPSIDPQRAVTLVPAYAIKPQLAAQGRKVVLAYTRKGKVDVRLSKNVGQSFGPTMRIIRSGKISKPSKVHSVSLFGQRIVVEATKVGASKTKRQRIESTNLGGSWSARTFGNKGPRMGVLRKSGPGVSSLSEAWLNNGSTSDTLRAQYETP